ncbi:hypothetical protein BDN72DRAFT_837004 [Pluteus cervinus]|uniref:Uncharacterized protein n=1 Tax=Pluteus cervinus TaxID=181527 RepID=A0ACD3B195_9AGAR|nr:hypothetical protein BDN72DRAFT_837004 [Pluteus cervinus]
MGTDNGQSTGLLSLPVELRLKIYQTYLQEIIIRIPGPQIDPNALALLCASRTIHSEVSPLVPSTITFSVWCTEHLIYFLSSLPEKTLQSLRHIALWATPFGLYEDYPARQSFRTQYSAMALACFPGLQLDTFSVRDGYHGPSVSEDAWGASATGDELEFLLLKSKGWKELRYFSPNVIFLDTWLKQKPGSVQPKDWDEALKKRDGKGSGALVKILVGREARPYHYKPRRYLRNQWEYQESLDSGSGQSNSERDGDEVEEEEEEAETHVIDPGDVDWEDVDELVPWREEDFVAYLDEVQTTDDTENKQVVVVARRGKDADIVEDGSGINSEEGMKKLLDMFNSDWRQLKRKEILVSGHRDTTSML